MAGWVGREKEEERLQREKRGERVKKPRRALRR
jgi:hypothetical protein